jgi:hypothetical protein
VERGGLGGPLTEGRYVFRVMEIEMRRVHILTGMGGITGAGEALASVRAVVKWMVVAKV